MPVYEFIEGIQRRKEAHTQWWFRQQDNKTSRTKIGPWHILAMLENEANAY